MKDCGIVLVTSFFHSGDRFRDQIVVMANSLSHLILSIHVYLYYVTCSSRIFIMVSESAHSKM
jgi:hypothetical protein